MSYSKRILFGDDPADDGVRQRLGEATRRRLEAFTFTIPTRRRNRLTERPYWDPFWASSLTTATEDLNIQTIQINSKICTKTQEEADAVRARAEIIHQATIKRYLSVNPAIAGRRFTS